MPDRAWRLADQRSEAHAQEPGDALLARERHGAAQARRGQRRLLFRQGPPASAIGPVVETARRSCVARGALGRAVCEAGGGWAVAAANSFLPSPTRERVIGPCGRVYTTAPNPRTTRRLSRAAKAAGSSGTSPSRICACSNSSEERSFTSLSCALFCALPIALTSGCFILS